MALGSEELAQAAWQQVSVLYESGKDEGAAVLAATTRFETALAKSDTLADKDASVGAKSKRDTTLL